MAKKSMIFIKQLFNRSFTCSWLVMLPFAFITAPLLPIIYAVLLGFYHLFFNVYPKKSTFWLSVAAGFAALIIKLSFTDFLTVEAAFSLMLILTAIKLSDQFFESDRKILSLLLILQAAILPLLEVTIEALIVSMIAIYFSWKGLLPDALVKKNRFFGRLFISSIPLAILLFFVFPRLIVPWSQSRIGTSQIGFSNSMQTSQMQNVAASDEVAFKVLSDSFLGNPDKLYWRSVVLYRSSGLDWGMGSVNLRHQESINLDWLENQSSKLLSSSTLTTRYEVLLEQDFNGAAFALDRPIGLVVRGNSSQLDSSQSLTLGSNFRTRRYQALSKVNDPDINLLNRKQKKPLITGKAAKFISQIESKYPRGPNRIKALKTYFANLDLEYTLTPGVFKSNELDEFLYVKKKGFCGHFAASFATLALGLDIPTRVILGFQGGSYNPYGQFYTVMQRDAHAWVEVFDGSRWERIDPVEWFAPNRLLLGATDFFKLSPEEQRSRSRIRSPESPLSFLTSLSDLKYWADDLSFQITRFLLDFDIEAQRDSLQFLAENTFSPSNLLLLLLTLLMSYIVLYRYRQRIKDSSDLWKKVSDLAESQFRPRRRDEAPITYIDTWIEHLKLQESNKGASLKVAFLLQFKTYFIDFFYRERESREDLKKIKTKFRKTF